LSKRREITISPATRIEGHGKVTIVLDEIGNVSDAFFHATELRGFEYFLRGMEIERLPFIVSRICGVCSTAHVIASVKAIETAYHVEVTETAKKLRELLLMGQIISNHSLVFFFLTLPDFWYTSEVDPSKRNIFEIMRENPEIGSKAIKLRTFGTHILHLIGRREVHIVSVIPGGLIQSLKEKERNLLRKEADEACVISKEALELSKELFEKHWNEFKEVGAFKTNYMAMLKNGAMEYYDGKIHIINPAGKLIAKFNAEDYPDYIEEKILGWTYAKFAFLKKAEWPKGVIQVGSTARMNVAEKVSTPIANKEFKDFKRRFGSPAHATLLFDHARLIELLYVCERAKELLEDKDITKSDVRVKVKARSSVGIGAVGAPRGTLFHQYELTKSGKLKNMHLIIPTQINNAAININVKDAASKFIKNAEVKPGLLNRIEMVVRAYDPCIKCATRSVGEKIQVEIKNYKGELIKILS